MSFSLETKYVVSAISNGFGLNLICYLPIQMQRVEKTYTFLYMRKTVY